MTHIRESKSRIISFIGMLTIITFGIFSTLGSGGGGGDGGTTEPSYLSYEGNTNPAAISLANTPTLVGNVLYGGISTTNVPIPTAASTSYSEPQSGNVAIISKQLLAVLHYSLDDLLGTSITGYDIPMATVYEEPVNETIPCTLGYYTIKGTLYFDDVTSIIYGTLNFNYVGCENEGVTYNGSGTFKINMMTYTQLDVLMSFPSMSMVSAEFNGTISGKMRMEGLLSGNRETDTITMNYVAVDNITSKQYKFESVVMTMIVDDITISNSSGSIAMTGSPARVYDSDYGYVVVDTPTPLGYTSILLPFPDDGGVMTFTGEATSNITLTVLSGRHVMLVIHINDVDPDETRYLLWEELDVNAGTDLTDTDGDGMHDSWETTYGLNPTVDDANDNLDGDGLTNLEEYQQGYNPNDSASP